MAATSSSVDVTPPPQRQLATNIVETEEKQRLFGVFPVFLVSYAPNPAPLTMAEKFQLGRKMIIDPVSLVGTGISRNRRYARNSDPEFRQEPALRSVSALNTP